MFLILGMTVVSLIAIWVLAPVQRELSDKQSTLKQLQNDYHDKNHVLAMLTKENNELFAGDSERLMKAARDVYSYCFENEQIYCFPHK